MKILRKTAAVILCFVLIAALFPTPEFSAADGDLIDGVYYKIDGDHAVVTGCSDTATEITVRSKYNNYPVTQIADSAFKNKTPLKKVTIADSVKSIGTRAFYRCGLTSIAIPDSVTSIGEDAFYDCTGLTSITIPGSVTSIGENAFFGCEGLKRVDIADLAKWCGIDFEDYISNPLSYAHNLYLNGERVTELVIPNGITSIGAWAFYWCTGLESITIPDSVTSIGVGAFYRCVGLTRVDITDLSKWCKINFGDSEANPLSYAHNLYLNGERVTNLVIPDSITGVGDYAFQCCTGLTSITIPGSVTSIGAYAFRNCAGLTSITISDSVADIGSYAFEDCTGLTSITIPDSVTNIGNDAFYRCTGLERVNITDLAKWCEIDFGGYYSNPLYYAHNLYLNGELVTEVVFPEGTTSIKAFVFSGCTGLTSITIPDSVTNIGNDAFYRCTGLERVNITDLAKWCEIDFKEAYNYIDSFNCSNPLYYAHNLYLNGKLVTEVVFPEGTTSIKAFVFSGCTGLTSITIPDSVTNIGNDAFYGCTGLERVNITDLAKWCEIDFENNRYSNPLYYAQNGLYINGEPIKEAVIPEGITKINDYLFNNCKALETVEIPGSVTSIGESAFYNCTDLKWVDITDLAKWCEIDFENNRYSNPLYYAQNGLYINGEPIKEAVIPEGITKINDWLFNNCRFLESVKIPGSISSIGGEAFYACLNLERVDIADLEKWCKIDFRDYFSNPLYYAHNLYLNGNLVTEVVFPEGQLLIKNYAFYNCIGLKSVTIPDSVTSIGAYAFRNCAGLTGITIPDSVTSIGAWAFYGCTGIESITIPNSITSIDGFAFGDCTGLKRVDITDLSKWFEISFDDSPCSDCSNPLRYAHNLYLNGELVTDLVIPKEVTSIGNRAFEFCTGLTNVIIPDNVTSIGNHTFQYCTGLTNVTIPDSVTSIGLGAFSGCENLTIRTVKGSYAEAYAKENNIPVIYFNNFTPETPTVLTLTENSVVLAPTDGYEYRMDDGEWQDSNVFENLTRNSRHKFYQRMKATANCPESFSSLAADISTLDHDYREEIIPPTINSQGYILHTCNNCSDTYKDNYTSYEPRETDPLIEVSSVCGIIGNQVKVAISLKNNPGIASMSLKLDYDANILKLVKVEDCGILGEQVHRPSLGAPYYLSWVNDTVTENFTENGNIVILTFEILEDAPLGKTPISVSYDYGNFDIYDVNGEEVAFATQNGTIDVANVLLGDVNGDGIVNNYDRLLLTRWLAKWPEALEKGIIEAAADVNCDGKINNLDRLILTRHLAHWEEYATLPYTK